MLKSILQQVETLLMLPCQTLCTDKREHCKNALVLHQPFWSDTKNPNTDIYPEHAVDTVRTTILLAIQALPRISTIDLKLTQKLAAACDTTVKSIDLAAEVAYDQLRRDAVALFCQILSDCRIHPDDANFFSMVSNAYSLATRLNTFKKEAVGTSLDTNAIHKRGMAQISSMAAFMVPLWHQGTIATRAPQKYICLFFEKIPKANLSFVGVLRAYGGTHMQKPLEIYVASRMQNMVQIRENCI